MGGRGGAVGRWAGPARVWGGASWRTGFRGSMRGAEWRRVLGCGLIFPLVFAGRCMNTQGWRDGTGVGESQASTSSCSFREWAPLGTACGVGMAGARNCLACLRAAVTPSCIEGFEGCKTHVPRILLNVYFEMPTCSQDAAQIVPRWVLSPGPSRWDSVEPGTPHSRIQGETFRG